MRCQWIPDNIVIKFLHEANNTLYDRPQKTFGNITRIHHYFLVNIFIKNKKDNCKRLGEKIKIKIEAG